MPGLKLKGVAAAAGGLTLTDTKITGTIPAINSTGGGFGGAGGAGGGGGSFRGSFTPTSFGVDGVDIGNGELGPLSAGKLSSGRTFTSSDANSNVAVLDSNYAAQNKLSVGSTITIAKTSFKVIGIVSEPSGQNNSDVYVPLARAQALASMKNDVNTIYVAASSAASVNTVSKEISSAVPSSTVTNSGDLANEVTGSLASTSSLANNLCKWLAIAVLVAAFLVASLLTMSAVSRRVREFGTLKALGWQPPDHRPGDGRVDRDRRHRRRDSRPGGHRTGEQAGPPAVGLGRVDDRLRARRAGNPRFPGRLDRHDHARENASR